jgi:hypothetical protein
MLTWGQRHRAEIAIAREYVDQLTTDAVQNEVLFNRICKQHGVTTEAAARRVLELAGSEMVERVERATKKLEETTHAK